MGCIAGQLNIALKPYVLMGYLHYLLLHYFIRIFTFFDIYFEIQIAYHRPETLKTVTIECCAILRSRFGRHM